MALGEVLPFGTCCGLHPLPCYRHRPLAIKVRLPR